MAVSNPKPMHPGRVLASVFMVEHNLNQTQLAKKLGCAAGKINEIINGRRGVTAEFALQLEAVFNLSAAAWVRMQGEYDVWLARESSRSDKGKKKKKVSGSGYGGSSDPRVARGFSDD